MTYGWAVFKWDDSYADLDVGGPVIPTDYIGTITIPSEYNGNPIKGIGECAFENCIGLSSVTIPSSIIEIEDAAFAGCSVLYLETSKQPQTMKNT